MFARTARLTQAKFRLALKQKKTPDSPVIHGVTMKVTIDSKARKELVEAAWRRTEANCPVLFIFKEPIPVKVELEVKTA